MESPDRFYRKKVAQPRLVHHSTIFELNVESYRRRKASDKQKERRRQLPNDNYDGATTTMNP